MVACRKRELCPHSRPLPYSNHQSASLVNSSCIVPVHGGNIYNCDRHAISTHKNSGPILNSGMCSEVFQFDISAASARSGGIIPASPTVNSSSVNATQKIPKPASAYGGKLKNRRIMYNEAIPLTGKTVNNTEPQAFNSTSESSKVPDSKPASSVVVSVLADPREAGNGDGDPRVSPKPLSRIFVVVLLDGVRYVTYSCTLPFKSVSPHLVN